MKSKKRITLLAVLVCVFALVLSLGIFSACGNDGENGGTATAGGSYLYGTTAPDEGLGNAGDYYLDTETLSAYVKTADGEWVQTALYSGTGAPDANAEALKDAAVGDLYLDTTGGVLYQKGESLWSIVLKVKGRDGVVWFSGTEEDPNKLNGGTLLQGAMKGDFYLDTTNFVVWQLGEDGQWNWLGSIKGDKGDDSVHVFYGTGVPEGNGAVEGAVKGDLYFGTFDGFDVDDEGAGTVLYRYNEDGTWEELMSDRKKGQINIRTAEQLKKFAESVTAENSYKDREVHLKANIDLSEALAKVSVFETIASTWTPIGTSAAPFEGTFDGEGFTISGFKSEGASAGLFGATKNAAIKNVTIAEATVTATEASGSAGILVAEAQGSLMLSGIKVENSTIKADENAEGAKVGALVGKHEEAEDGEVTVKDVEVSVNEADTELGEGPSDIKHQLVGLGEAKYEGTNELDFELSPGFVEKIVMEGEDQKDPTYEISSANGLTYFAKTVNGDETLEAKTYETFTVKLVSDIDLNNEEWTPIGGTVWETEQRDGKNVSVCKNPFKGTFDGNWKTISNLKITEWTKSHCGLFGYILNGAVKRFTLRNANVSSMSATEGAMKDYVGTVAGGAQSTTIEGVTVKGDVIVHGGQYVGGILGHGVSVRIVLCKLSPDTKEGNGIFVHYNKLGGIIGHQGDGGMILGCTVENVLIKAIDNPDETQESSHEIAWGQVGGIAGLSQGAINGNTLNNVTIDVTELRLDQVGDEYPAAWRGKTGALAGNVGVDMTYARNKGNVSIRTDGFPPVEKQRGGLIGSGSVTIDISTDNINVDWDGLTLKKDGWHISDPGQYKRFADYVKSGQQNTDPTGKTALIPATGYSFVGEYVYLDADIDFGGETLPVIGDSEHPFSGYFDGKDHTLSNFTVGADTRDAGMFASLKGSNAKTIVENLTIKNVTVNAKIGNAEGGIGVIAGEAVLANVENVSVTNLKMEGVAGKYVGGLVGAAKGVTIDRCSVEAAKTVTIAAQAGGAGVFGGLAGKMETCTEDVFFTKGNIVTNSHVKIDLNTDNIECAGGIVGQITMNDSDNATIENCYVEMTAEVNTETTALLGGIAGILKHENSKGAITSCYVKLAASGYNSTSEKLYGEKVGVAGILALGKGTAISDCFVDGSMTGGGDLPGGRFIISNDEGDYQGDNGLKVENCSWSGTAESYQWYGAQNEEGNHVYGTVTRSEACTFEAGMTYDEFTAAVDPPRE